MTGATFGKINLKLVRRDKGEITYNVNKTVNYGCSDADFESALNSFNSFKPFVISVTRTIMDAGNNVITAFSSITDIIHYDVSIYKKRSL
jgi:HJR/Mrr/RecB family endonuclease